jgi:hypothetical protein
VQPVRRLISEPANCDEDELDDVPLQTRLSSAQKSNNTCSQSEGPENQVAVSRMKTGISLSVSVPALTWSRAKTEFCDSVAEGHVYVCSCCRQLWFKRSVVVVQPLRRAAFPPPCLTGALSKDGKEYLCKTCYARLLKGKVPSLAPQNIPEFRLFQMI